VNFQFEFLTFCGAECGVNTQFCETCTMKIKKNYGGKKSVFEVDTGYTISKNGRKCGLHIFLNLKYMSEIEKLSFGTT